MPTLYHIRPYHSLSRSHHVTIFHIPLHNKSYHITPYHITPYYIISHTSDSTISSHSKNTISHHFTRIILIQYSPYDTTSFHTTSFHTTPFHVTPFYTISFHIIPLHIQPTLTQKLKNLEIMTLLLRISSPLFSITERHLPPSANINESKCIVDVCTKALYKRCIYETGLNDYRQGAALTLSLLSDGSIRGGSEQPFNLPLLARSHLSPLRHRSNQFMYERLTLLFGCMGANRGNGFISIHPPPMHYCCEGLKLQENTTTFSAQ